MGYELCYDFDKAEARDEARFMCDAPEHDEHGICPACNGSGEGNCDDSVCERCHGKGEV